MQTTDLSELRSLFPRLLPQGIAFASLRYHRDREDYVSVRQNVLQPLSTERDEGVMVTVHVKTPQGGGIGYGATPDLSEAGLREALAKAIAWAERNASIAVTDFSRLKMPHPKGSFRSPVKIPWDTVSMSDKIDRLMRLSQALKVNPKIVDWSADLWHTRTERLYLTSEGGEVYQDFDRLTPMLKVSAHDKGDTQTRTLGGGAFCRQQGLELLDELTFDAQGRILAEEALALLDAPNCPTGVMDLLLAPDQMTLQIHESIGHPLELDRILGDERNYAGTSFVTPDMFGAFQYGSELLNVTYDPGIPEQTGSFAFDDEGLASERQYIIKDGILLRGLGATVSQTRLGLPGVANARADSWRRPAIDRMANLNVEPGTSTFDAMLKGVERGIYMQTNCSWSIDDSRNKFQFGCESARLIENGRLTTLVKKPNYRGISASFWRSLKQVGDRSTFAVMGTPNCGKGEPNQAIYVGHASPACLFANVDVFGGE
jgi:predicted Zn-dependent protease